MGWPNLRTNPVCLERPKSWPNLQFQIGLVLNPARTRMIQTRTHHAV